MRLSGLKLAGFKSFVDPTHLPLPSNLTAVVGPNGCGKSNLIDAVRWVLGESSMKNLRGSDSEDVIFNGSKTRKPAGRASVELLFDNADGAIGGPYAAYSEISVRRELTRDGASQYFLNGRKCLKRDVTDLFLGTGLGGKNQYAIIEQGMVSRMVEARPEELRQWLEEAAGISKYKDRRRETETRLRHTRENLDRLNDLRTELQGRLDTLARQAANAEKYRSLKAEEQRLRAELLVLKARGLAEAAERGEAAVRAAEDAARAADQALEAARGALAEAEARQRGAETAQQDAQARLYEREAEQARARQALAHAQELQRLAIEEQRGLERRCAEAQAGVAEDEQRRTALEQEIARLVAERDAAQQRAREALEARQRHEAALAQAQRDWEDFVQQSEAPLARTEAERVRVQTLLRQGEQLRQRLERTEQERAQIDLARLAESVAPLQTELVSLQESLKLQQAELAALEQTLAQRREQRRADETALHQARQALQAVQGRLASLETLQQAALRQDDAGLDDWLKRQGLDPHPRLAQRIEVDPGWEVAVEQLFEPWLAALSVPDGARPDWPPTGPAAGLSVLVGELQRGERGLAARLRAPAALLALAERIHTAASAEEALQRAPTLPAGESVVSPEGVWAGRGWLRYPKAKDERGGVIARRRVLEALGAERDRLQAEVAQLDERVRAHAAAQQADEERRRRLLAALEPLRAEQARKLAQRQTLQLRLEQAEARAARLAQEKADLEAAIAETEAECRAASARLAEGESQALALRDGREQRQRTLAVAREAEQGARREAEALQAEAHRLQLALTGRQASLEGLVRSLEQARESLTELERRLAVAAERVAGAETPLQGLAQALAAAGQGVAEAQAALRTRRAEAEAAVTAVTAARTAVFEAERAREAARARLEDARVAAEGLRSRCEALAGQIAETGFEPSSLAAGLPAEARVEQWEERLATVLRRIERLGAINLAAIQELDEAKAKAAYLDAQRDDLLAALETLEAAMRKIDGETRSLFRDTFERVNAVFTARFPQLFGGGEASLELVGDSLLEAGVRVMARPPGKRNTTIQLLSGGEKAMTAVALLLALFQLNPAPFCLMDEVDAPLDDANVGRFCEVVREMSASVQFIIITHNKITMELAQQLHGVTMQEPGVSRLVSVDVDQAVALTEATEGEAA